jgi:hypothetical protein
VRRLLGKFPTTELAARSMNETDWTSSLFVSKLENGKTYVTVPANIEAFSESLFMIAIIKLFEIKQWIPVVSTKELPTAVFETKEGAFFAGFISAASRSETGKLNDGTSKYNKGERAYQTYSVEKEFGKVYHLKIGGLDKLLERLSVMKGFTKDYWGLRGALAAIFKSVKPAKVTELTSFFQSENEIAKHIKTKLHYKNGGIFRPEELAVLDSRYHVVQTELDKFLSTIRQPTEALARDFADKYSYIKGLIDRADNEIKPVMAARARILFPQDKKKKTVAWSKKSIQEKILDIENDSMLIHFAPDSLPGVQARGQTQQKAGSTQYIKDVYGHFDTNPIVLDMITSWYNNFVNDD